MTLSMYLCEPCVAHWRAKGEPLKAIMDEEIREGEGISACVHDRAVPRSYSPGEPLRSTALYRFLSLGGST